MAIKSNLFKYWLLEMKVDILNSQFDIQSYIKNDYINHLTIETMLTLNKTTITVEPGKLDLFITREFDAPRERVFKAYTDARLFPQWVGPREDKMTLLTFEPKNGGNWQYISTDKDGNEFGFHGVYHEVLAPERIIDTFEFEGLPEKGHVCLETIKFESIPGNRTKLTIQAIFQTVIDRDGMIQADMERGVNEGFERLDELLLKEITY